MIGEPRKTGLWGEIRAARYLKRKGYSVCAANFKAKSGEIDIIAEKDGVVVFVEVKARREGGYFPPSDAVDSKKEENVKSAAAAFLSAAKIQMKTRFDIIEVVQGDADYKIRHIENAF